MPYLGRTPAGAAGNVITGDLRVTGAISADSIHESIILNGTDGSKSNANDNVTLNGTDASSTNADDRLIYEEETGNFAPNAADVTSLLRDSREAFLQIASASGQDRLNMIDGIVDPYNDETDVDTTTSTNESYDSTNDRYNSKPAAAADGTFSNASDGSGFTISSGNHWGMGWTATTTGNVTTVRCHIKNAGSGSGPDNVKMSLYTNSSGSPGTQIGTSSDSIDCETTGDKTFTFSADDAAVTASTIYWMIGERVSSTGEYYPDKYDSSDSAYLSFRNQAITSGTDGGGSMGSHDWRMEINITPAAANQTLVSNAFTAKTVPAIGRVHIHVLENEAITINSDITAEVSRDGGTTFTAATLSLVQTLADGTKAYEDSSIDISGQPSGSAMKYRLKNLNTVNIAFLGTVFQWA